MTGLNVSGLVQRSATPSHRSPSSVNHESVPGPLWNLQTVRDVLCRPFVTSHRGRSGPREVIMHHPPKPLVVGKADVFERLVETRNSPLIHLFVSPVAAVNPDDKRLIAVTVGICRGSSECLRPVRGKALSVLRVISVAERMADHIVL